MERTTWTDHRLDDFARQVDGRFDQVDKRFDQVDGRFDQMDNRFDRLESEVRGLRTEFHSEMGELRLMLFRFGGGLMVGLVGVIAALIANG